jgi:sugar phosphate isomerase/epimerase
MNDAIALGLCSVTFRALSPAAIIALAGEAGIAGVEWGADKHVPAGDLRRASEIAARCRDCGLAVASYGSYIEAGKDGQDFSAVLDSAAALGAPNIRVWAGQRGVGSAAASPAQRSAAAEALRMMAARAAASGITLSLEFHPNTLTDTAVSARALIAAVEHANLYSYWQPRPGIALPEALAELAVLGDDLAHLHVFAWTMKRERLALAEQAALWRPVLGRSHALPRRAKLQRYAMLEFVADDDPAAFRHDATTLAAWLEEMAR